MTVNNLCRTLIVYGSYAPGGANHPLFVGLPGEWKRGKIVCDLIDPPDGIGPGESDEIEAWTIEFSDCQAEMFTPEYESQKRLLHDRWTVLDQAMGPGWVRDGRRWWPENSEPVVGQNGMIVVNAYVPVKYFPYLANQEDVNQDVPSPDEEEDLHGMWTDVKAGRKRYDWSWFISLIKDATPEQYSDLFGDLPGGEELIRKLRRFYQEHQRGSGNLLWDGESERFSLYVSPLQKHVLSPDKLISLVKADIANRTALLRESGFEAEAEALGSLDFVSGRPSEDSPGSLAAEARIQADEIISDSRGVDDHWMYCLKEACYGIAASYELANWLMSHWLTIDFDFEPAYGIWKSGGSYEISGNTCYVFQDSSDAE